MVYAERTDKCLATSKDNAGNPSKSQPKSYSSSSSSSSSSYSSSSGSSSSSGAWSSQASSAEKWKYNDMVRDNRDKFNGMHFS